MPRGDHLVRSHPLVVNAHVVVVVAGALMAAWGGDVLLRMDGSSRSLAFDLLAEPRTSLVDA